MEAALIVVMLPFPSMRAALPHAIGTITQRSECAMKHVALWLNVLSTGYFAVPHLRAIMVAESSHLIARGCFSIGVAPVKVTTEKLPKSLLAVDVELDQSQVEKGLDRAAR